jgi:hypothetical protein
MAKANLKPTGIQAGGIYPTQEFCDRMGWGRKAFVAARRRGLPVRKESRRIYVIADEAIEWFKSRSHNPNEQEKATA